MPVDVPAPDARVAGLVRQGRLAVCGLGGLSGLMLTLWFTFALSDWGASPALKLASLTPGLFATALTAAIAPPLWARLACDGRRFSGIGGALAGALTALLVQTLTLEVFLFGLSAIGVAMGDPVLDLRGTLAVAVEAPLRAILTVGRFTLPPGIVLGGLVAIVCQHRLTRNRA